jgi:hypothetical protein
LRSATFLFLFLLVYQRGLPANTPSQPNSGRKTSHQAAVFTDSSGLFPLNTGNLWQLRDSTFNHFLESEVVGDTTLWNGETYAIVDGYGAGFGGRYVRQEGSRLLIYYAYDSAEVAIYDFAAEPGDTIGVLGDFTIVLGEKYPVEFYGRTLTEWTFCVYFAEWITVIDSIGLYRVSYEPGVLIYDFQGAIIDGVQYGTITGVVESPSAPMRAQLSQNYPNPFNPSTTIAYAVGSLSGLSGAEVVLKVYDLLGREVATLVNGKQEPGRHTVVWDATGQPSGVYFYRLRAGNFVETRNLLLLR